MVVSEGSREVRSQRGPEPALWIDTLLLRKQQIYSHNGVLQALHHSGCSSHFYCFNGRIGRETDCLKWLLPIVIQVRINSAPLPWRVRLELESVVLEGPAFAVGNLNKI